jgi:hypothetical protein
VCGHERCTASRVIIGLDAVWKIAWTFPLPLFSHSRDTAWMLRGNCNGHYAVNGVDDSKTLRRLLGGLTTGRGLG